MIVIILVTAGFVLAGYIGFSIYSSVVAKKEYEIRVAKATGSRNAIQTASEGNSLKDYLTEILDRILGSNGALHLARLLSRAGIKLKPTEYIIIIGIRAVLLGIVAAIVFKHVAAQIIIMIVALALSWVQLKSAIARRLALFSKQLPDALSLISSALKSGFTFQTAAQLVTQEMPSPIAEEFDRMILDIRGGQSIDQALKNMVARVPSYDLELVTTAVSIQREVGGDLAIIIDNTCETIRERIRIQGEISVLTAEGRLSGMVLVILPIALACAIGIMNPDYMRPLIMEPFGRLMLAAAVILQIVGAVIINQMLKLDY